MSRAVCTRVVCVSVCALFIIPVIKIFRPSVKYVIRLSVITLINIRCFDRIVVSTRVSMADDGSGGKDEGSKVAR